MKKTVLFLVAFLAAAMLAEARDGFAIVIDTISYKEAKAEVDAYAQAIRELNGYEVFVIEDRWGVPDSIRTELKRLHFQRRNPIVGAVFVGNIPVPMIRGGQHLTTAFKMDEKMPRKDSSIPSDRFYDDFGLLFDYVDKDNDNPYFYYTLKAEGSQQVRPDIYSGRIRPTDKDGKIRLDALKDFLGKAVEAKRNPRKLEQMLYFGGHGYISESRTARVDEKAVWLQHFPWMDDNKNHISYIYHTDANPVKEHLMNEVMRTDLDLAVLHHHGAPETEYLSAGNRPYMVKDAKAYMQKAFRGHLWKAREKGRDFKAMKEGFKKEYDIPESWFADAFDKELHIQDSLESAAQDINLEDFEVYGYRPNARVVILDACFNGSFHLADCIADEYIFQPGTTIAVQANTVNALQDKWNDRLFGLLAQGGCVGDISRYAGVLESHIIGDPTYRFANGKYDVDHMILKDRKCIWRKLLRQGSPDLQALAVEHLYRKGAISSDRLLKEYRNNCSPIVRMQALECLGKICDKNFIACLQEAVDDSNEYIRRMAIKYIGRSGDPLLIPTFVRVALTNNQTARVAFGAAYAASAFEAEAIMAEFDRQAADGVPMVNRSTELPMLRKYVEGNVGRWDEDEDIVTAPDVTFKQRRNAIRQLRSYLKYSRVPEFVEYAKNCADPGIQVMMLEALGWHTMAYNKDEISAAALDMSKDPSLAPEVREEALKTYRRINVL